MRGTVIAAGARTVIAPGARTAAAAGARTVIAAVRQEPSHADAA
jgi:3-deoxy-D-arabino-heptulosonate 7-phosphate (DAHP) synthase